VNGCGFASCECEAAQHAEREKILRSYCRQQCGGGDDRSLGPPRSSKSRLSIAQVITMIEHVNIFDTNEAGQLQRLAKLQGADKIPELSNGLE
jgi:hypothetical protein